MHGSLCFEAMRVTYCCLQGGHVKRKCRRAGDGIETVALEQVFVNKSYRTFPSNLPPALSQVKTAICSVCGPCSSEAEIAAAEACRRAGGSLEGGGVYDQLYVV
jgi:hypothetical protein